MHSSSRCCPKYVLLVSTQSQMVREKSEEGRKERATRRPPVLFCSCPLVQLKVHRSGQLRNVVCSSRLVLSICLDSVLPHELRFKFVLCPLFVSLLLDICRFYLHSLLDSIHGGSLSNWKDPHILISGQWMRMCGMLTSII